MEAVLAIAAAEYFRKLRRFIFHRITVVSDCFAMEEMTSGWSATPSKITSRLRLDTIFIPMGGPQAHA
jgi:hypothetical protein